MYKRTKIEAEVHPRFLCLEEFMNYTGLGRGWQLVYQMTTTW